jgi:hypothetical protein
VSARTQPGKDSNGIGLPTAIFTAPFCGMVHEEIMTSPATNAEKPAGSHSYGVRCFNRNTFDFGTRLAQDGDAFLWVVPKIFAAGASRAVPVLDIDSSNWSVDSAIMAHIFPFPSCEP